jgi:hypothetical protein
MLKVWAARINSDLTEGRGPMVAVGYYKTEDSALRRVEGQSTQGTDGEAIPVIVWDNLEEEKAYGATRERALAKLTAEERKVLGI